MAGSTFTWTGATSDPSSPNWSPAGPPQPGDTAIIPGGAPCRVYDTLLTSRTFDLIGNGAQSSSATTQPSSAGSIALSVIDATGTATTLALTGPARRTPG